MLPSLAGKGAIVTGGGSGICLAFVQYLYNAECSVLICDLALHREAVAWLDTIQDHDSTKESQHAGKPRVVFHETDVSDWKQLDRAFDVYDEKFGGVPYILCPGAGIYEPSAPNFWNDDDHAYYKIIRINLEHPLKMSRIAIRRMVQANQAGIIIHVSSTGAQKSSILTPLYGAAKQGISNFTRGMTQLQTLVNIRVVAVAPGPTMSPLFFDHPEAQRFVDFKKDKLCAPAEIARAMIALCQDDERFPPGTVLEVTHPDQWREVSLLNDPGPPPASFPSNKEKAIVDVIAALEADRNGRA